MYTSHEDICIFVIVSHWILRMRNVSDRKVAEKIKTRLLYSVTSFRKLSIMWKNILQPGRRRMTIWRTRIAFWMTCTFSVYVILTALPRQQWLCESASMLRYTYIASLVWSYYCYIVLLCSGVGNTGWSVRGSNTSRGNNFFLLEHVQTASAANPTSCSIGTEDFNHGGKAMGAEVDCSCPSTVVAKNKWIYTSAASLYLRGVCKDKFTFTFTRCNL